MGAPLPESEYDEFKRWLQEEIVPFLMERDMDYFEYGADSAELEEMLRNIFAEYNIGRSDQYVYHWMHMQKGIPSPNGYGIRRVDQELLRDSRINNDFMLEEIESAYGDVNRFFNGGIAYVAIAGGEVVARADMLFWGQGFGNISVSTKEQH